MNANINKKKDMALFYAEIMKWEVLPLHSISNGKCTCWKGDCGNKQGKHPRTLHGLSEATTDIATISKWWDMYPDANIGIRTGSISGFFALDIDPRHGGNESMEDIIQEYGDLPHTIEALTGGGGKHYLFKYPQGADIKNDAGVKPGIDVRGKGGYIVAEPSIHVSGQEYNWELSAKLEDTPIAEAPEWLLTLLTSDNSTLTNAENSDKVLREGVRNDTLTSFVGRLHQLKLSRDVILSATLTENKTKCNPPLPDNEITEIVNSVMKYPNNLSDTVINKDPALLFYPKDVLSQCFFLSDIQCGFYLKLICLQHQLGHLTKSQVLKICGTQDNDMLSLLKLDSNACYYIDWVDIEIKRRAAYAQSRRENRKGKKKKSRQK